MTFLELCQRVARESGASGGDSLPTTVTGQSGRARRIVDATATAWRQIQNRSRWWLWMRDDFDQALTATVGTYAGSSLIGSRYRELVFDPESVETGMTIYDPSIGRSDESYLRFLPWHEYRVLAVGEQVNQRPAWFTVKPAGSIVFHPTPDIVYNVRGEYQKTPQELTANADTPEMPAHHHDVIWLMALQFIAGYDESGWQLPFWQGQAIPGWDALVREQLPSVYAFRSVR